jgi:hypothetical protein
MDMIRVPPGADRPVCSIHDLAWLAAANSSVGADEAEAAKIYLKDLLRARALNRLKLGALRAGDDPKGQQIFQTSAVAFWHRVHPGLKAPALIAKIVEPEPPDNPRGDYSLEDLALRAKLPGIADDDYRAKLESIQHDVRTGVLVLATRSIGGGGGALVNNIATRSAVREWARVRGCDVDLSPWDWHEHKKRVNRLRMAMQKR